MANPLVTYFTWWYMRHLISLHCNILAHYSTALLHWIGKLRILHYIVLYCTGVGVCVCDSLNLALYDIVCCIGECVLLLFIVLYVVLVSV